MNRYKIIYADPPWPVSMLRNGNDKARQFDHYTTMKVKDIAAMPIVEIAEDDAVLFLWTTNTFLPDAINVIKAWGFKYHCTITWDKKEGITMRGFHRVTEFLLFAYRGKFPNIGAGKPIKTLLQERRTAHSRKPKSVRDMIVEKFGDLPRLELFARESPAGWDVWGNEVERDIEIEGHLQNAFEKGEGSVGKNFLLF